MVQNNVFVLMVVSFLVLCLCGIANSTESLDNDNEISWKEKVTKLMDKYGKMGFDNTITEEIAHDIYNKHITGYYNNKDSINKMRQRHNNQRSIRAAKRLSNLNKNSINKDKQERRRTFDDDGNMDDTDREYLLNYHNLFRINISTGSGTLIDVDGNLYPQASNMNYIFWDDALAALAEDYADELAIDCNDLVHNSDRTNDFYTYASDLASFNYPSSNIYLGENIGVTWTSSANVNSRRFTNRLDDMWEEYEDYYYTTFSSNYYNGNQVGHFTQLAWAKTRYLGCGTTKCYESANTRYRYYIVCNYWPGGNFANQYPYESGTCNSNNCDTDRSITCENNLCSGCMDPAFRYNGSYSNPTQCNNGFENVDDYNGTNNNNDISNTGDSGDSGDDSSDDSDNNNDDASVKLYPISIFFSIFIVYFCV